MLVSAARGLRVHRPRRPPPRRRRKPRLALRRRLGGADARRRPRRRRRRASPAIAPAVLAHFGVSRPRTPCPCRLTARRRDGRGAAAPRATSRTSACSRRWSAFRASCSSREPDRDRAYEDAALPIGAGQTISQPYMVARICEVLALRGERARARRRHGLRLPGRGARRARRRGAHDRADARAGRAARARRSPPPATSASTSTSATARSACPSTRRSAAIAVAAAAPEAAAVALRAARARRPAGRPGRRPRRPGAAARRPQPGGAGVLRSVPCRFVPLVGAEGFDRRVTAQFGYPRAVARLDRSGHRGHASGPRARRPENWIELAQVLAWSARAATSSTSPSTSRCSKGAGLHYLPAPRCSFVVAVDEQLHLEPALDVPRAPRPRLLPGAPLPGRLARRRSALNLADPPRARRARRWARSSPRRSRSSSSRRSTSSRTSSGRSATLSREAARRQPLRVALLALRSRAPPRRPRPPPRARLRRAGPPRRRRRSHRLAPKPNLTEEQALARLPRRAEGQALARPLPEDEPRHAGDVRRDSTATGTSKVWSGKAGRDRDRAGRRPRPASSTEAWTGPQVAWKMARGGRGRLRRQEDQQRRRSGSRFCAVFLLGLADLRRPLSLRNLDLLALLSFSVSLWYFNHGHIFTSVPLVYPGLAYLLAPHDLDRRSATGRRPPRGRSGRSGCWPRRPSSSAASGSG